MRDLNDISYFGRTNARMPHRRFGIRQADRPFHFYVIGRTGTGKSSLLETLALQDIDTGRGLALIDPHGDLAERVAAKVSQGRRNELIYFNAPDPEQPFGYNPLRAVTKGKIPLAASGLMEAFKKLFDDAWGPRMEHQLRNALYALLEYGEATLPDVLRIFTDKVFRANVLERVTNPQVRQFWLSEFPNYNPRWRQEAIAPIQSKVGAFLADPTLYRILTAPAIDLHFRKIMDEGKILIVNLSKGRLGEDSTNLLGALLVTTLGLAAFSRGDQREDERKPFYIYVDEFQNFTTLSVANMVSELRKFGVGLTLAHQHLHQLEPPVRHAILGNIGTVVAFRLGPEDAAIFSREFVSKFDTTDFVNLPNYNAYVRLVIDGAPARPFSATTLHAGSIGEGAQR